MSAPSVAAGPPDPLPMGRIGDALARTAADHGGAEALVVSFQGVRWTWAELLEKVDAVAAGLARLGLAAGDRVGIWAPNGAEWVLTQLASARAGLVLVAINPAYRPGELGHALQHRLDRLHAQLQPGELVERDLRLGAPALLRHGRPPAPSAAVETTLAA